MARTILLFHIISARPSKQPHMVRTFLKVYMESGSYFLFLQEQIKDTIIRSLCRKLGRQGVCGKRRACPSPSLQAATECKQRVRTGSPSFGCCYLGRCIVLSGW